MLPWKEYFRIEVAEAMEQFILLPTFKFIPLFPFFFPLGTMGDDCELISQLRFRLAGLPCSKNSSEKFNADELASFSDSDCMRFLLARDKNVDKAADMVR
jgi:hypothetical protein